MPVILSADSGSYAFSFTTGAIHRREIIYKSPLLLPGQSLCSCWLVSGSGGINAALQLASQYFSQIRFGLLGL